MSERRGLACEFGVAPEITCNRHIIRMIIRYILLEIRIYNKKTGMSSRLSIIARISCTLIPMTTAVRSPRWGVADGESHTIDLNSLKRDYARKNFELELF